MPRDRLARDRDQVRSQSRPDALTMGLMILANQTTVDNDVYASTYRYYDTNNYLTTCLGAVPAPRLEKSRIAFSTALSASWDDVNNSGASPNSQGVWMHEIGHFLGLTHRPAYCSDAIMNPEGSPASTWEPQETWYLFPDDIWRIQMLYPRQTAFPYGSQGCP